MALLPPYPGPCWSRPGKSFEDITMRSPLQASMDGEKLIGELARASKRLRDEGCVVGRDRYIQAL